ncbi:MAG: NAD(+)--dinitrogen-reductase ADP-D-ribosyltransferase [Magnetococcales bacterium]|nr:NAD(+)--dinitrogen-reductase ADP-D-ribosyltransferase [Magnetococcales bacterium]
MASPDSPPSPRNDSLTVPPAARLLFNRCNLPAAVLGSWRFQQHPHPLELDGVRAIHADLFRRLERLSCPEERVVQFMDYMVVYFALKRPEDQGFDPNSRVRRDKADYLRMLRGWLFNPDGREAAVLKGWVSSRFGLLPRYHGGVLDPPEGETFRRYLAMQSEGIYNTNFLEGQLDLLYTFCQEEMSRKFPDTRHMTLFRGLNRLEELPLLRKLDGHHRVVLLNNLNSFTRSRERADEFGDRILECAVPLGKIFFYNRLLPGILKGEEEFMVIGGVYEVTLAG